MNTLASIVDLRFRNEWFPFVQRSIAAGLSPSKFNIKINKFIKTGKVNLLSSVQVKIFAWTVFVPGKLWRRNFMVTLWPSTAHGSQYAHNHSRLLWCPRPGNPLPTASVANECQYQIPTDKFDSGVSIKQSFGTKRKVLKPRKKNKTIFQSETPGNFQLIKVIQQQIDGIRTMFQLSWVEPNCGRINGKVMCVELNANHSFPTRTIALPYSIRYFAALSPRPAVTVEVDHWIDHVCSSFQSHHRHKLNTISY